MFLLSDVLNSFRDASKGLSISILFDKNKFSGKIYLFSSSTELNQPAFNKVYNSILAKSVDESSSSLFVKSITSWVTSRLSYSVRMTKNSLTTELEEIPSTISSLFANLSVDLFREHTIIEISCKNANQDFFADLLLNDSYLCNHRFQLINDTNKSYKIIDICEPKKQLETVKQQKLLIEKLVNQKLSILEGRLTGIRQDYTQNNINYFLVCLLHGFKSIDEYENLIKLDYLNKNRIATSNEFPVLSLVSKNEGLPLKKLTVDTLIDDIIVPAGCIFIIDKIKKFSKTTLNVGETLKVDEYKFEWLQGVTPEMLKSFKVFRAMLSDAVSDFSESSILLKSIDTTSIHSIDQSIEENKTCSKLESKPEINISLKTKLKEIELPVHFSGIVKILNQVSKIPLTVYVVLNMDSYRFFKLSRINSKHQSDFFELKIHLQNTLNDKSCGKHITLNSTSEPVEATEVGLPNVNSSVRQGLKPFHKSSSVNTSYVEGPLNSNIKTSIEFECSTEGEGANPLFHNENIPEDVEKKIKNWALEGYFDDKEMYNHFIQEQSDAYLELKNTTPKGMAEWIRESIYDFTDSKYEGDFSGQLREVKQHIESYFSIEAIVRPDETYKLRELKQSAREEFPGDYNSQLHSIKTSLKAIDIDLEWAVTQETARQEIAILKPKDIRSWDWDETLEIIYKECPNDSIGQLKALKLQVSSFHYVAGAAMQGYENEIVKLKELAKKLFAGNYSKQHSYLITKIGQLKPKSLHPTKGSSDTLSVANVKKDNTNKPIPNRKVKELNKSVLYDKNKSEKGVLSKLSSVFKPGTKTQDIIVENSSTNDSSSKTKSLLYTDKGDVKNVNSSSLNKASIVEDCHFVKFKKKSDIGIEVQAINSFDAFDFESINNRLVVVINSNHPFYSKLYRDSSVESKRVIDMMIASLCHLSHLNISETVKQQDKKLFSRWSEYLEDYLLED